MDGVLIPVTLAGSAVSAVALTAVGQITPSSKLEGWLLGSTQSVLAAMVVGLVIACVYLFKRLQRNTEAQIAAEKARHESDMLAEKERNKLAMEAQKEQSAHLAALAVKTAEVVEANKNTSAKHVETSDKLIGAIDGLSNVIEKCKGPRPQ